MMQLNTQEAPLLAYRLGGLLYIPALMKNAAEKLTGGEYACLTSAVFCLEDSIMDGALEEAENCLLQTLASLSEAKKAGANLPLLFVRPRSPEHLDRIALKYRDYLPLLSGFVLPKFDDLNADAYCRVMLSLNSGREKPLYMMPIIESERCISLETRVNALIAIKQKLKNVSGYVLNVRVGGNDFSSVYGLRRNCTQTVYDIAVVRDALADILNVFAKDYVVSGPVWEYYSNGRDGEWEEGLRREMRLDRLNGFIGKTCIHPSQLPVIFDELRVSRTDYEDAKRILGWEDGKSGVGSSEEKNRMNEVKCHMSWARKTVILGEIYGIRQQKKAEGVVQPLVQHGVLYN